MTSIRLTSQADALGHLIGDRWPYGTESRLLASFTARLPGALQQMAWATPDGYPTSVIGAEGRGGGGGRSTSLDNLGNLVARRAAGADAYREMSLLLARAALCVAEADRQGVRRAISDALTVTDSWQVPLTADQRRSMLCARTHPDDTGIEAWVDPLCERVADLGRAGLCETCYRRRFRAIGKVGA